MKRLQESFRAFSDLIFPRPCVGCDTILNFGEELLCTTCRAELAETNSHHINSNATALIHKFSGKFPVQYVWAYYYFVKGGRIQQVLHQLKYGNQPKVGILLGNWYGAKLKETDACNTIDLLIPVPLHPRKLRKRGYNQSVAFAQGISQSTGILWSDKFLKRTVFTETQTQKNRIDRFQNVENVFSIATSEAITGKHIAIIDDVVTTGSTIEACAKALLNGGASNISVITLATA